MKDAISTTEKEFEDLVKLLDQPTNKYNEEFRQVDWSDELGRFRVWASKIGVGNSGQDTVDSRIDCSQDAVDSIINRYSGSNYGRHTIRQTFTDLLQKLREDIQSIPKLVTGNSSEEAGEKAPSSGIQVSDKKMPDFNAGDADANESSADSTSPDLKTELPYFHGSIHEFIDALNEMSDMMSEHLAKLKQRSRDPTY